MLAVMSPALSRHSSNPMEDHRYAPAQESDDPIASYVVPGSVSDSRRHHRAYEEDDDEDDGLEIVYEDEDELLLGAGGATRLEEDGDGDEEMDEDEDEAEEDEDEDEDATMTLSQQARRHPQHQEQEEEDAEQEEDDDEEEDELAADADDDEEQDTMDYDADECSSEPSTDEETTLQLREADERQEIEDEFRDLLAAVPRLAREYVLLDRLGTGTFSTVYKARDLLQARYDNSLWKDNDTDSGKERLVAIKRINVTSSPDRIRNEIVILSQVAGCRHVSQLITAFREKDQVVAVMPYCRNEDFRNFYNTLPIDGVRAYFRCLFRALRDIHARGIVHRDVKPANFLFDPRSCEGTLVDFGLAMHIEPPSADNGCNHSSPTPAKPHGDFVPISAEWTHQLRAARRDARARRTWPAERVGFIEHDNRPISKANRAGTRGFRPPEVLFKCNDQSGAVDVWAAGTMMLFFLTGRFPVYVASDDVEALMELAAILGFKRMEKAAILHNRTFITNVPAVTDEGITWREFVLKLCPALLDQREDEPDDEYAARHGDIEDALELVELCLEPEAPRRITARDALLHPFLLEAADDGNAENDDDWCVHPPGVGACARMHRRDDVTGDWSVLLHGGGVRPLAVGEGLCVGRGPCAFHAGPEYEWEAYVGPWEVAREAEEQ